MAAQYFTETCDILLKDLADYNYSGGCVTVLVNLDAKDMGIYDILRMDSQERADSAIIEVTICLRNYGEKLHFGFIGWDDMYIYDDEGHIAEDSEGNELEEDPFDYEAICDGARTLLIEGLQSYRYHLRKDK